MDFESYHSSHSNGDDDIDTISQGTQESMLTYQSMGSMRGSEFNYAAELKKLQQYYKPQHPLQRAEAQPKQSAPHAVVQARTPIKRMALATPDTPDMQEQSADVERLRTLLHKLRATYRKGTISEQLFKTQYAEVKKLYIEALEDLVK